ncbi:MAG: hypothetical protein A2W53_05440 [Nitrospinae bacterium RIFCSPHIGHO2_02_39_11]|nr:MAG: hypothetical protein A2W53_05440 [Nitrospinae bacterium RIFCSPHIGHO2_02_39_11]
MKEKKSEETVEQEEFNKSESGVQFADIMKTQKGESIEQEISNNLDTGISFKEIIKDEKKTIKRADDNEKIKQYEQIYDSLYEFTKGFVAYLKMGKKPQLSEAFRLIEYIVDNSESLDILYRKAIYTKTADAHISNIVNVIIYALEIGEGLKFKRQQLIELGVASLLHDIGMFRIPDNILNKTDKLTNEEFSLIKSHPSLGHEILLKLYPEYPWMAEVALQEHEKENGQGYPNGLKGNAINIYAKIVGIADIFESLTHHRPQRKRFLPNDAVKIIISKERETFPREVIKAMLTKLSVFPLYSYVRLNSKAVGMVIEVDEPSPLRPTIKILYDDKGRKVMGEKIIILKDTPLLYIIDSVDEEDLPK